MRVDFPDTDISKLSKALVRLREEGGANALGRVLTLVIVAEDDIYAEQAITAANDASREHPMRVIVLSKQLGDLESRLDAEIRIGGDAGASEVIILKPTGEVAEHEAGLVTGLLLPDAPVVTWWPSLAPMPVANSPLGRFSQRRITDSGALPNSAEMLAELSAGYTPGDTDLAWTRITNWRAQLAATLDQPPYEAVVAVELACEPDNPSAILMRAWLEQQLKVPVIEYTSQYVPDAPGIHGVKLIRASQSIVLERVKPGVARINQQGQPEQTLTLPRRELSDCLAEELRRLDADPLYGEVIRSLDTGNLAN